MSQSREHFERTLGVLDAESRRMVAVENIIAQLVERPTESTECVPHLMATAAVKARLKRSQDHLASDLEIGGLPEVKGENDIHLFCLVAEKLRVKLEETNVVCAERVRPLCPGWR